MGQDTAVWESGGLDLAGLVDLLAADDRLAWLRVMYLQPEHVDRRLPRVTWREQPKLCRYLDVPFQHSHPDVLRRMGRRGRRPTTYLELLGRARRLMPDVALRSTFIVGFPGETEEHFEHLLGLRRARRSLITREASYTVPRRGRRRRDLKPARAEARWPDERLQPAEPTCWPRSPRRSTSGWWASTRGGDDRFASSREDDGPEGVVAVGRTPGQAPEVDGVTYIEGELPDGARRGTWCIGVTMRRCGLRPGGEVRMTS